MLVLQIIIFVILALIAYEDFKYLAVSWFYFPVLAVLVTIHSLQELGKTVLISYLSINLVVVVILFTVVFTYVSIKQKTLTNIFKSYIGMADLLILLIFSLSFSPINFVAFMLVGFVLSIFVFGLLGIIKKNHKRIPLAGVLALEYVALFILSRIFVEVQLLQDDLLLMLFAFI